MSSPGVSDSSELRSLARKMGLPEDDPQVLKDIAILRASAPTDGEASSTAAGWYPNPDGLGQRYWDGSGWSDRYADDRGTILDVPPPPVLLAEHQAGPVSLVRTGYSLAVLLPFVGFIIGVVLLARRNDAGAGVMVVSVLAAGVWAAVLAH